MSPVNPNANDQNLLFNSKALPIRGPRIEILDANGRPKSPKAQEISYAVGDKIELRCNSAPSKPAARLRWYLNEHEIIIPSNATGQDQTGSQAFQRRNLHLPGVLDPSQGHDVRITPVDYRLHYKGIYSSHSTFTLVLQQNDLINNKISFKCLASMRQDVGLQSKQLILLPSASSTQMLSNSDQSGELGHVRATDPSSRLMRRDPSEDLSPMVGQTESDAHKQHYQRPQHFRHSMSRLSSQQAKPQARSNSLTQAASTDAISDILRDDLKGHMLYVYEESYSTLGPSIVDRLDTLQSFMFSGLNSNGPDTNSSSPHHGTSSTFEFNKADNLDYIQMLRDKASRFRSLNQLASGSPGLHGVKRGHSVNSLVKSPLYIDELDPMRPLINWPPLDSGKLILLPAAQNIVAIPTRNERSSSSSSLQQSSDQRFVLPPKSSSSLQLDNLADLGSSIDAIGSTSKHALLDKLVQNLNCTCTEGSLDVKLNWLVDEIPVNQRDIRHYPVRISPDHRQTWSIIGLAPTVSRRLGSSLLTKGSTANTLLGGSRTSQVMTSNELGQQSSSAIKIACQATHSVLLYSSSEMITFDFNPPPTLSDGATTNDRFTSLASNVIQATSG